MSYINNNRYFPDLIDKELKKLGLIKSDDTDKKIHYCDISYGNRNNPSFNKCEIVSQLSDIDKLGNKKDQYENHLNFYKTRPDYLPFTMSFNLGTQDNVRELFVQNPRESPKCYVLKPEDSRSRKGVGIVRNSLEFITHLDKFPQYTDWIIQEYIDNPLLINDKKFHFRIYVIYIQNDEYSVAYLGKKGFIYTANKSFQEGTFDPDVVLSGENSVGNVLYVPDDFVKTYGKNRWDSEIWPQIVKICRETLKSALDYLKCPARGQKCFKILGYDILINDDYKCYLAEINARNVSYKYPNKEFRDTFYKNILKLVLSPEPLNNKELTNKKIPYERILYRQDGKMIEGFNGLVRLSQLMFEQRIDDRKNFDKWYGRFFFPFLILVLVIIAFQIRK